MIKVAAFTSGQNVPSARFRVRQLIEPLNDNGVAVKEYSSRIEKYSVSPSRWVYTYSHYTKSDAQKNWAKLKLLSRWSQTLSPNFADIIWLERVLIPGKLTYELKFKKPVVFDLDDAIWLENTEGYGFLDKIITKANMIFCGNSYLADYCSSYNKHIEIIPTSVDIERFCSIEKLENKEIKIGWIGTPSNFTFLESIEEVLFDLKKTNKNLQIHICSSHKPIFKKLDFIFTPWSSATEVEFIQLLDIGLMPLPDNLWTQGKCSFKMLQYLSCGVPAVASPVGMNKEVLNDWGYNFSATTSKEWQEIIQQLISDTTLRKLSGNKGREMIELKYSSKVISKKVSTLFKTLV